MSSLAELLTPSTGAVEAVHQNLRLSWAEFLRLLIEIDSQLISEGVEIGPRAMKADMEICRRRGRQWTMMANQKDPISEIVHQIYSLIYGQENLYIGSLHVGAIMLRDAFFEVHVPFGYGTVHIDLWERVEGLTQAQRHAFATISPEEYLLNTDQIIDVFDFGWADDLRGGNGEYGELLSLAKEQIEGACRTLRGGFSRRVAVQGCAYSVELTAKALLAKAGSSREDRRKLGHNLPRLMTAVEDAYPHIDAARCEASVVQIPPVVDQRYNNYRQSRFEIGTILRYSQYLIAEMARQISDLNVREDADLPLPRTFPAM